jgi:ketosteroid isomerase-like protein
MSQENVEIVRAAFVTWDAGDIDAFRELYDPHVIMRMRPPEGSPEPEPFVGREAVIRQFKQARENWDAEALEPISDFIHAADRVAVRAIWRGGDCAPDLSIEWTIVCTVRKGKVIYQEFFFDQAEALEAVGLSD